eukprot:s1550_g2.t1
MYSSSGASTLLPGLAGWWKLRVNLCRASGVPACSGPETIPAFAQNSLDVMYSRQLVKDSQIRWASPGGRPDLGETSLALVDAQEESVEALRWVLQGKDLTEGRGGGQINKPGVYRTICLEVNLRSKLCICALQHARYLSDMEGGELSRKMIRKARGTRPGHRVGQVGTAASQLRNMDHSSEASVTNLESLVSMVQDLCSTQAAKVREMENLWNAWAKQSGDAWTGDGCSVTLEAQPQHVTNLLDGLYGWLASPSSLLYDAALLRRVQQYMDRVLKLLIDVIKRNGCSIIHASYSKVGAIGKGWRDRAMSSALEAAFGEIQAICIDFTILMDLIVPHILSISSGLVMPACVTIDDDLPICRCDSSCALPDENVSMTLGYPQK